MKRHHVRSILAAMRPQFSYFTLVAPAAGMFDAWFTAFEQYGIRCGTPVDRKRAGVLWRWLLDGTYRMAGVVALDTDKNIAGFAHFHPFPQTLNGDEACMLDDLFVVEGWGPSGVAQQLFGAVCATARQRGWHEVRWTTAQLTEQINGHELVRSDARTYSITV
jgi:GNAT superfamily N-acetyltransferase